MEANARLALVAPAASTVPAQAETPPPSKAFQDLEQASRYRLVIEEGPQQGTFIYKTLDSTTGEILRQFPRDQLVKLAQAANYNSGSVIDTSA
ncbi:hypothetical protein BH10PSE2_BH10PSE2_30540 [soil metagenome]